MSIALRTVFAGTPEFAVPTLERLIAEGLEMIAVYTQPDRPAGRGRRLLLWVTAAVVLAAAA